MNRPQSAIPGLGRLPQPADDTEALERLQAEAGLDSLLEARLLLQIRERGLPEPVAGYRFHPQRAWKADFAYPQLHILIECEGGTWMRGGGRHNRGEGYENDCSKYNGASIAGWVILRYTSDMIRSKEAVQEISDVLHWKMKG